MRALVLRGFCISVGKYAEVGQTVDLPDAFCLEMQRLGAVEPEPVPVVEVVGDAPAAETPAEPPAPPAKSTKHPKKGA